MQACIVTVRHTILEERRILTNFTLGKAQMTPHPDEEIQPKSIDDQPMSVC